MKLWIAAAALVAAMPASTSAGTFTVDAQDNIYGAGQTAAPGGGNVPTAVQKLGLSAACVTIAKVAGSLPCAAKKGCIQINTGSGDTPNDADGAGSAAATFSNTGTDLISGIAAPYAGYLVGVFTTKKGPKGAAPAALDFTTGEGTAFTSLSPALDQTFFIGDGLTGDHKGIQQTFTVPSGARKLWLGISDAPFYSGSPGAYSDNIGSFTVVVRVHNDTCP
jgi:hypothetical protein